MIAGHRRFLALKALGVKPKDMDIKILDDVSDVQAAFMSLSENKNRKNLKSVEEGRAFRTLQKLKVPLTEIVMRFKVSETYVRNRLALLDLPDNVQEAMEQGKLEMGYAKAIKRVEPLGKTVQTAVMQEIIKGKGSSYSGVQNVEDAEELADKLIASAKYGEELVAKYGKCPQCDSGNIEETYTKNQLHCKKCGHTWHKQTRDPWAFYELKKDAEKLGLKLDLGEGKAKLTGKDVTEIMKEVKGRLEATKKEDQIPKTMRTIHTVSEILAPFIKPENINLFRIDGESVEIRLIQDSKLHFTAGCHNYNTGEKTRVTARGAWQEDETESRLKVKKYIESLETD